MRIVKVALLTLVALGCMPAIHAQGHDTIYMTVDGLTCNSPGKGQADGLKVTSWQMGFTVDSGTTGGPAGKPTFVPLTVTRPFDECSPQLLPDLFTGKVLNTVTLTQYSPSQGDTAGVALMVVTLTSAAISNYTIGGDATHDPAEVWTFKAEKICVKNVANNAQACWDFATNTQ
ncbi:MAG TPA: type VI secretion system tube protein Hcp [Terracidiphilus sp.]|nr:type VI secretion system tube protein Hcp [Terracidiphilus sp.]